MSLCLLNRRMFYWISTFVYKINKSLSYEWIQMSLTGMPESIKRFAIWAILKSASVFAICISIFGMPSNIVSYK